MLQKYITKNSLCLIDFYKKLIINKIKVKSKEILKFSKIYL